MPLNPLLNAVGSLFKVYIRDSLLCEVWAMRCCLIYDEVFLKHETSPHHPENPNRLIRIMKTLSEKNITKEVEILKPFKASIEDLLLVHDEHYVKYVKRSIESGHRYLDPDTPVCKDSFDVALYAVGASILGCEKLVSNNYDVCFVIQRPPGHHAGKAGIALGAPTLGFCIFNNIAIAAKYLVDKLKLERVAIFDFDCHHGNGTQEIFYENSSVLYISTHQDGRTAYPGTGFISEVGEGEGKGFNINIPLPPNTADDVYREVISEVVEKVIRAYKPKMLLFSAGFDAHKDDPITSMNLSIASYVRIAEMIKKLRDDGVVSKFLFILEGGYGPGLPKGMYNLIAFLSGKGALEHEDETHSTSSIKHSGLKVIKKVIDDILKPYWGLE